MMRFIQIVCALLISSSLAGSADAATNREMTYQYSRLWNALVRFLRVDNNFAIREKDREAGYILFEYKEGLKKMTSSIELVPTVRDKRRFIRARLQIADMPSYVEGILLDKFERKLKDEYGAPPPPELVDLTKPASRVTSQADDSSTDGEESNDDEKNEEGKDNSEDT